MYIDYSYILNLLFDFLYCKVQFHCARGVEFPDFSQTSTLAANFAKLHSFPIG